MAKKSIEDIKAQGSITRDDIAEYLKSVGSKGSKKTEKKNAIKQLFKDAGFTHKNIQGVPVWADSELSTYEEF